jgi:hypothetical protein
MTLDAQRQLTSITMKKPPRLSTRTVAVLCPFAAAIAIALINSCFYKPSTVANGAARTITTVNTPSTLQETAQSAGPWPAAQGSAEYRNYQQGIENEFRSVNDRSSPVNSTDQSHWPKGKPHS